MAVTNQEVIQLKRASWVHEDRVAVYHNDMLGMVELWTNDHYRFIYIDIGRCDPNCDNQQLSRILHASLWPHYFRYYTCGWTHRCQAYSEGKKVPQHPSGYGLHSKSCLRPSFAHLTIPDCWVLHQHCRPIGVSCACPQNICVLSPSGRKQSCVKWCNERPCETVPSLGNINDLLLHRFSTLPVPIWLLLRPRCNWTLGWLTNRGLFPFDLPLDIAIQSLWLGSYLRRSSLEGREWNLRGSQDIEGGYSVKQVSPW